MIEFFLFLSRDKIDGIFLGGDISTGPDVVKHLRMLEGIVQKPIYFITGNHDNYRTSFASIDYQIELLTKNNSNLIYLTKTEPISLTNEVALIGDSNWCDGRWKEPLTNFVFVWDWFFISEFRALFFNSERLQLARDLADESAARVRQKLIKAFETHKKVVLSIHFPGWPVASSISLLERFWHPYNSSKVMGEMLEAEMRLRPDKKLTVLAGHVHQECKMKISDNIEMIVGGASRGKCQVQEYLEF